MWLSQACESGLRASGIVLPKAAQGVVRLFPGLRPGGKLHPDKGYPERSTGLGKPSWFGKKRTLLDRMNTLEARHS